MEEEEKSAAERILSFGASSMTVSAAFEWREN
jgi:hypothetical protein